MKKFGKRSRIIITLSVLLSLSSIVIVRGASTPIIISSSGTIGYNNNVEFGFSLEGPYYTSYSNPVYSNTVWQTHIVNSGAIWVRHGLYGVFDSELVNYWRQELTTVKALGLKTICNFGLDLIQNAGNTFTPDDWRVYVIQALNVIGDLADVIEVWNEPDWPSYQYGYMDGSAEHYFDLLQIAYEEIKEYDPTIPVLAGSFMTLKEGIEDYGGQMLQDLWQLGAGSYCDAVSFHIYQYWLDEDGTTITDNINEVYTLTNKKVWITEIGAQTSGGSRTEQTQADWLRETFTELSNEGDKLGAVIWFNYYADASASHSWSILNPDFSPKLAYYEFQEHAT